ncbi:MAG: hypothetical protein ACI3YS_09915 [Prevotella sp.]
MTTRRRREDDENKSKRGREQIETGTRSKQNKLQTTITNYYTRFWPFTWRVLQINPSGSTPKLKTKQMAVIASF